MLIGLLRHGVAEDAGPGTGWQDEPRALTGDGREKMIRAAAGIAALSLDFDALLTSPLVRCLQTAEIVGDALELPPRSQELARPGMTSATLIAMLMSHPGASSVLVCGHQPDLSHVASDLVGGGDMEFKKGALAVIELEGLRPNGGCLRALYPPAVLRRLASR
jgi:phosphohistidine phosphatase